MKDGVTAVVGGMFPLSHALRTARPAPRVLARFASSFIARAKEAADAQILLGPFQSAGRYDRCLEDAGMHCTAITSNHVTCVLTVSDALANNFGTLHGGCIATIIDVVGTLALLGVDPSRAGVSVEMNQTFCSAASIGDRVSVTGTVLRYGRTLGFTEVTIAMIDADGKLGKTVAVGRHTKYFP